MQADTNGERGPPACSLLLKAAGFPCWEQAQDAKWPQDSPILIGLRLGWSAVFQRFFYYQKEKKTY